MSETDMRRKIVKLLEPLGGFAVENPCLPGTPDVNHYHGWIELKQKRSWPRKLGTVIRLHRFTKQQKMFLRDRWNGNQDAYLMVRIRFEWFLFKGNTVAPISKEWNRQQFYENSFKYWSTTAEMEQELVSCLSKKNNFYEKS